MRTEAEVTHWAERSGRQNHGHFAIAESIRQLEPMKFLLVAMAALALLASPAFAADHTPWPGREAPPPTEAITELAQKSCCKRCTKGQPRGNTCINKKATCKSPPGCAC